jgi:hypothetical protein
MDCTLGKGDLLRINGQPGGVVLRCLKGTVWITNGNGIDYLVHEEGVFRLDPTATALIEALCFAEVSLKPVECGTAGTHPALRLAACRPGDSRRLSFST